MTRTSAAKAPAAAIAAALHFIKIGADGAELELSAPEWVAVLDKRTNLLWSVEETDRMNWKDARAHVEGLELARLKDWRLPMVEELFLLADRTKFDPAIDKDFFPACHSNWYWTGTPDAEDPADFAWYVHFYSGDASVGHQGYSNFVRAVRPRQSLGSLA